MSPPFSLFLRKIILSFQSQRQTGPSRLSLETSKSTRLSLYGVHQCKQHGWLVYMCEGTIDTEAFIGIILRHILPSTKLLSWEVIVIRSRQCQLSFCTCYNCMAWKTHVDVTDWPVDRSTNKNVWLTQSHGNSCLFFGFCLAFCLLLRLDSVERKQSRRWKGGGIGKGPQARIRTRDACNGVICRRTAH